MASEKLKEVREWSNFAVTVFTAIGLPLLYFLITITLNNQRLEIEKDAAKEYVHKEEFNLHKQEFNDTRHNWDTGLGELRGSLNAVLIQQTHQSDAIENLKERFDASARRGSQ